MGVWARVEVGVGVRDRVRVRVGVGAGVGLGFVYFAARLLAAHWAGARQDHARVPIALDRGRRLVRVRVGLRARARARAMVRAARRGARAGRCGARAQASCSAATAPPPPRPARAAPRCRAPHAAQARCCPAEPRSHVSDQVGTRAGVGGQMVDGWMGGQTADRIVGLEWFVPRPLVRGRAPALRWPWCAATCRADRECPTFPRCRNAPLTHGRLRRAAGGRPV